MTVAVGICTYNRPRMLHKAVRSALKHLNHVVDGWYVYDDGSDPKYTAETNRAVQPIFDTGGWWMTDCVNRGVAHTKNQLLTRMLDDGHDWLFLMEDDLRVLQPEAVTGYLDACHRSGYEHLSFAHHGNANQGGAVACEGPVSLYGHAIGAWCLYTRQSLETAGLFDEGFHNAWEHVEHTLRLAKHGFTTGAYRFADATGSQEWLEEFPDALTRSVIRPRPDWASNIIHGLTHWQTAHPDTYLDMFGAGQPLHGYATRTLQLQEVTA